MTKQAYPEPIDLAEAVASGELRAADAERQLRAAVAADSVAAEKAVRELRTLVLAATAVRSHARATRQASAETLAAAEETGSVATVVARSVRGIRRPSSRNGDGRGRGLRRTWLLVAATIAVGTGVIGASLLGSHPPTPTPQPTVATAVADASASPEPSQNPAVAPSPAPAMFAYIQSIPYVFSSGQLWVANLDGTNAHELVPDLGGNQQAPVWSPDGSRLLFSRAPAGVDELGYPSLDFSMYLTDANGSEPELVDTGCVAPCTGDGDAAFSPDGTHLVFVRSLDLPPTPENFGIGTPPTSTPASVIATIDLSNGRVTELASTMIVDCPLLDGQAARGAPNCEGLRNRAPAWSADGTQIVFTQDVPFDMNDESMYGDVPPAPGPLLLVVDQDGRELRQISPNGNGDTPWVEFDSATYFTSPHARWSPDGSRIVFVLGSYRDIVPNKPKGNGYTYTPISGIYTIRPDGTDLRQLIADGAFGPSWTSDGRILFGRMPMDPPSQPGVMDADGSNARQLSFPPLLVDAQPNLPAITALAAP